MKRFLYAVAILLLLASAYFVYQWFVSEPQNQEPLPALLSIISTLITTFIAWKMDSNDKPKVKVAKVKKSIVDVDEKEGSDYDISEIRGNSKVFINKGKDSFREPKLTMTRKWISKFQKIFPDKQIIADEKGNIIVKNIDNSFVYINPLDVDDLQKLRKELHDDRLSLFDGLISELQYLKRAIPKHIIKHLYTIDELKRSSRDNNILFENDLAFFTEKEIENHLKLIEYLKRYQVALLSGGPATGKSISVVDIANRLEERGFVTY